MHHEGHLSCLCSSNICHCLEFVVQCLSPLYPSLPLFSSVYVSLHSAQIDGGCWLRAHRGKTGFNLSLSHSSHLEPRRCRLPRSHSSHFCMTSVADVSGVELGLLRAV